VAGGGPAPDAAGIPGHWSYTRRRKIRSSCAKIVLTRRRYTGVVWRNRRKVARASHLPLYLRRGTQCEKTLQPDVDLFADTRCHPHGIGRTATRERLRSSGRMRARRPHSASSRADGCRK